MMNSVSIPHDLAEVLDDAWQATKKVPGFLGEDEARFLGMVAACAPSQGSIVEIGSFKGKSTVMLAKVAKHCRLGPVVAIDPHNFNDPEFEEFRKVPNATTYDDFLGNLEAAGVSDMVDVRRNFSNEVAASWDGPIRFLWIDGDHTYAGAKADFDGFLPHVSPYGVVAFHDALHEYPGPIRVFVEDVLRSEHFGAAGFVGSIAWSQFRPEDGALFKKRGVSLERRSARLSRFFREDSDLSGVSKVMFKLNRYRVPRSLPSPQDWASLLNL
jgi:predicted O-methyltransferase YrrM